MRHAFTKMFAKLGDKAESVTNPYRKAAAVARLDMLCDFLNTQPLLESIGRCNICHDRPGRGLVQVGKSFGGEHFDNEACGCKYCHECLQNWISAKLDERMCSIGCPSHDCGYILYARDIKRLAPTKDYQRHAAPSFTRSRIDSAPAFLLGNSV